MENKSKRYYKVGEMVWVISEKKTGKVMSLNKESLEATVSVKRESGFVELQLKMWEIDKLKYAEKEKFLKNKRARNKGEQKTTYFASVKGGVVPTKDEENAGRDCYARLEPIQKDGKEVFELYIKQLTLASIPLGFASYLDKKDMLSLKHEKSSIGKIGLINVSGLIDSTYLGEVILQVVPLTSNVLITSEVSEKEFDEETNTYKIPYSKSITQAVVLEQSRAKDKTVSYEDLLKKPSKRGVHGWGSTGK